MTVIISIDEDFSAGLGFFLYTLIQSLILVGFVYFLDRASLIAAVLFLAWCAFGFVSAVSGQHDSIAALFGYLDGVLCFVGIGGVVKGIRKRRP